MALCSVKAGLGGGTCVLPSLNLPWLVDAAPLCTLGKDTQRPHFAVMEQCEGVEHIESVHIYNSCADA
jgi:hypothetical protein